ncbi:hypothetical protein [Mesorhizobium mediterraneum]|uniref:hypothetical protein n=1 Tax=Mesorhizobium mediterraneum TaxID=43617 RepID=UPI00178674D4|nr:hypothetical protein [Mesorhizobium mediterraneum]
MMQTVKTRVLNLERRLGGLNGPGLFCVVSAGPSDGEVQSLLEDRGVDPANPNNMIMVFKTIYEGKEGGLAPKQPRAKLLYSEARTNFASTKSKWTN